jgi:Fibronectin type III domain
MQHLPKKQSNDLRSNHTAANASQSEFSVAPIRKTQWLGLALIAMTVAACGGGGAPATDSSLAGGNPPEPPPGTGTATLQWSAAADSRVIGYRVYYGTTSHTYQQAMGAGFNAGAAASFVATNLQAGQTYYFAVTSYDAASNESAFSNEASKLIQ